MKNNRTQKFMNDITKERRFHLRLVGEGVLIGLFTGCVIAVFRYLLHLSEDWRPMIYDVVKESVAACSYFVPLLYCASFFLIGWLLMRLVRNEPMCTGSGIPQIKGILVGKMHMHWLSVLLSKLVGGVLAIGAGLSLGREGPSVQLGACVGQGVSRNARRTRYEERILLTAGSGAGLAAAFNAPLAGVIFGLEELQKSFSPVVLMASITAAVTATTVTQIIFGAEPVFQLGAIAVLPLELYGIIFVLGIFVGSLGRVFNNALLFSLDSYDKSKLSPLGRAVFPLVLAGILGFVLPEILGGGNRLVDSLSSVEYSLYFLVVLFIGKFLFTMICFGSGVPGGIFLPMLVLGAVGGAVLGKGFVLLGVMPAEYTNTLIVFGMAAYFSAVVKSPVTGSILIMEMTGSFQHLLALICVSMTAYMVSELTGGKPVYDQLLERSLRLKDKVCGVVPHRRVAVELVVNSGSQADGSLIDKLQWPANTVLVDIRRGLTRVTPDGNTRLLAGDYLYILTEDISIDLVKSITENTALPKR